MSFEPVYVHGDDDDGISPDVADVQQQPDEAPALRTVIEGVARVTIMPSRSGASRNYATDPAAGPVILLGRDQRRRRATIIAQDSPIYVGERDDCANGSAAVWPPGVPLVIEHTEQVYVLATTETAVVSVIAENWAD